MQSMGLQDECPRSLKELYVNGRRLGLGIARSVYVVPYALGVPAKQIAHAFGRSEDTVRGHLKEAFRALEIDDKTKLYRRLLRRVPPSQSRRRRERRSDSPLRV